MSACNDKANSNCLYGFRCPRCGSREPFNIEVTTTLTVYDDGGGDTENHEWDDDSFCQCIACGFVGAVSIFTAAVKGGAP